MDLSLISIPVFVLVLGGLVFFHELGHFLAARAVGVHVEEFGIGFPPRVLGVVRDDDNRWRWFFGLTAPKTTQPRTIYSLNLLPIGGFVRPKGEDDPNVPGGLSSASKRARLTVLFAGPLFNLILAFIVFTGGFMAGWPEAQTDRVLIATVVEGAPAAAAGLQVGDALVQMAGQEVRSIEQVSAYIYSHLGQAIPFMAERNGERLSFTVTPRTQSPSGQGPTGIQLGNPYVITQYSLLPAAAHSIQEMYAQFDALIHLPGQLIQKQISMEAARPCGPVCLNDLTRVAVQTAQRENQIFPIIQLIGMISVALALTNLLPIPALDGGRILFVLIEAVRGRRMNPERENMVQLAGMLLLLALMVVITYQDIVNPLFPR